MLEGVAHTLRKERRLQSATAQLWNRSRTAEQRNSVVHTQHACGAGFAVNLSEEARTLLARCSDDAGLQKNFQKFRMPVCSAPCADVIPELGFFRTDNTCLDMGLVFSRGLLNGPIKDVADLDRSVVAGAEQVQRGGPSERTHFMQRLRPAAEKEALDLIKRGCAQFLK